MKAGRINFLIVILAVVALLLGYNYVKRPFYQRFLANQATKDAVENPERASGVEPLLSDELARMTPSEKMAELLVVPMHFETTKPASGSAITQLLHGDSDQAEISAWIEKTQPSMVVLSGKASTQSIREIITQMEGISIEAKRPILVAGDQVTVDRLTPDKDLLPRTMAQACSQTPDEVAKHWNEVGYGWQTLGLHLVMGPVIDVPQAGSFEASLTCANNARAYELARANIAGFGRNGVLPVVAHFPGIGQAIADPQLGNQTLDVGLPDLEPFQRLLKEFPNIGVLISATRIKGQFNEQPCALTAECLAQFPSQFPEVLLIADKISPDLATALDKPLVEIVKSAILAGNHLVIIDESVSLPEINDLINQLTVQYEDDEAFRTKVNAALDRIIKLKFPPAPTEGSDDTTVTPAGSSPSVVPTK